MLSLVTYPLAVLHLWLPLALSAKALRAPPDSPSTSIPFLLHYWAWYGLVTQVHFFVASLCWRVGGVFLLAGAVDLAVGLGKVWLFYGHGCVVLSRVYLPRAVFAATGWDSLEDVETRVVDPGIAAFFVRNRIFQAVLSILETGGLGRWAPGVFAFNRELVGAKRPQFLAVGVEFWCYVDSSRQVAERVRAFERFLGLFRQEGAKSGFLERSKSKSRSRSASNAGAKAGLSSRNISYTNLAGRQGSNPGTRKSSGSSTGRKGSKSHLGPEGAGKAGLGSRKPSRSNLAQTSSPGSAAFDFYDQDSDFDVESVDFMSQYTDISLGRPFSPPQGASDLPLLRKVRKPPMGASEYSVRRHERSTSVGGDLPYPFEDPNPADPGMRSVSEVVRASGRNTSDRT